MEDSPSEDAAAEVAIVFLGDSLSAGFGLVREEAFPFLVEQQLRDAGWPVRVVNAGVSGDTSAGGRSRIAWVLRQQPDIVVVELGGNDGLRGLDLESTEGNLRQIILEAQEAGCLVLLTGMQIPTNYGPDYTRQFRELYPVLAAELEVDLMPFLLEGVAADPELNLPDGIHPNPEGHRIVADNLLPYLEPLVGRVLDQRRADGEGGEGESQRKREAA
ncbi:MAG: arylesterase [Acidobacteriota bacterium]